MPSELKRFPSGVKKRSLSKQQQNLKIREIIYEELKNILKGKIPIADYYKKSDYLVPGLVDCPYLTSSHLSVETPPLQIPPVSKKNPSNDVSYSEEFTFYSHDLTNYLVELNQENNMETQKQNNIYPIPGEIINSEAQSNIEVQFTAENQIYCPAVNQNITLKELVNLIYNQKKIIQLTCQNKNLFLSSSLEISKSSPWALLSLLSLLNIFGEQSIPDSMKTKFITMTSAQPSEIYFLNLAGKRIPIVEIVKKICVRDLTIQILDRNSKDITLVMLYYIFLVISQDKGNFDGLIGPDTAWKYILEKTQR